MPIDLGSPTRYDRSTFPLMKIKGKNPALQEVDFVLEATLDEIFRMRDMAGNIDELQQLILDAKDEYDALNSEKAKLEQLDRKKSLNPIKLVSTYRSIRLLAEAASALWSQTRSSSERVRRHLLSVHAAEDITIQTVDYDDLPPDSRITGIVLATEENGTELDSTTASMLADAASHIASQLDQLPDGNPFTDNHEAKDLRINVAPEDSSTPNSSTDNTDGVSYARANVGAECVDFRINVAPEDSSTPNLLTDTTDGGSSISSNSRLSESSTLVGSLESSLESGNSYYSFQNSYVASGSTIQMPALNVEQWHGNTVL